MAYAVLAGLMASGTYLLIALGFTVLLRVADIVNIAQGAFVVAGMYATIVLVNDFQVSYPLAVPLAVLALSCAAWLLWRGLLRRARMNGHRPQIVLSLILLSIAGIGFQLGFGSEEHTLDIPLVSWDVFGVSLRREAVISFIVSIVACALLYYIFRFTAVGKTVEVAGRYEEGARAIGIPVDKAYAAVFLAGSGMAFLAGALIVGSRPVNPFLGLDYIVVALVLALSARLSFLGCVFTASLYGIGFQLLQVRFEPDIASAILLAGFVVLIAIEPVIGDVNLTRRLSALRGRRPRLSEGT